MIGALDRQHGRRALIPYAAMLGSLIAVTAGTSFAKQLFPHVGAEGTALYRAGFSALVLMLLWRPWRAAWSQRMLIDTLLYGAALGLMNLLFYKALERIPLGPALAIEFLGPLSVALFHSRRLLHFFWVGLAIIGLVLLLPIHGAAHRLDPVGVGYALAAAIFWALYIVFGQRGSDVHPGHAVAVGLTVAAIVIAPFGIAAAGVGLFNPHLLMIGFIAAIISSALPFSLERVALAGIPKRTFGVLVAGEPAMGALAGMLFLGEMLSLQQWVALACIIAAGVGSVLSSVTRSTRADAAVPAVGA